MKKAVLQDKRQIRENVCLIRERQGRDEKQSKSDAICRAIASMERFDAGKVENKKIALYFTHKGEVDLARLKEYFIQNGAVCYYPVTLPDKILLKRYNPDFDEKTQCRTGAMGIQEPDCTESDPDRTGSAAGSGRRDCQPGEFEAMDWIFIPGVAFDAEGNRIGYGKGYYDRYLTGYPAGRLPLLVAPAFEFQLFEHLSHEPHDIPVDIIVTEERIIDTKRHIKTYLYDK